MSLVGNLEDLGLGDILQIVSLSRKSGVLALNSRDREGKLVFLNGQVICATSSVYQENLGHILLRKSLIDLANLKKALSLQRKAPDAPRLGVVLAEHFNVPKEQIELAVKEQVERIVFSFFGWIEGTFSFDIGDQGDLASTSLDPLQFMLDQGLNPQWLAMEGSRLLDEKRHRGEVIEEQPFAPEIDLDILLDDVAGGVGDKLPAPPDVLNESDHGVISPGRIVLLVDDDELTRRSLHKALREQGFNVREFKDGQVFLQAVEDLSLKDENPCLLVDLIMPRMDGSGILGGLELLEIIAHSYRDLDVFILTDHPNQDAEKKVRALGFPDVLAKPKKDALRDAVGQQSLLALAAKLSAKLGGFEPQQVAPPGFYHFGRELLAEMGEVEDAGMTGKGPESPGLHLLKGMLQELSDPALGGGVTLLVLRFASELMNRAVIFLVKEEEVVGLGQFGILLDDESADTRVRKMRFPRQAPSVLSDAINGMEPVRTRLSASDWDQYLVRQLGGFTPEEVFLGPILSGGKVVALIYGDNAPGMKPVGDTESFEIFLSQAGLAMEKALVERSVQSKTAVPSRRY
jgi:CheY-like chemotaxis protein